MQDDVTDGVMRMIADGTVDPERVCTLGASYGGYSALVGGAMTPDLYKCVISVSGVSDLPEMLEEAEEEYGRKSLAYQGLIGRVGDRKADRKALAAVSPSRLASHFEAPVLLIHGSADDIAPIQHSRLMYNALLKAKKGARFIEIPGEAHDIQSPKARLVILQEVERFLRAYIGDTPTPTS
jgi:dipeptidyl aminopeptidase/acylaminoacyl peptidase